jgi:hypothetical protein
MPIPEIISNKIRIATNFRRCALELIFIRCVHSHPANTTTGTIANEKKKEEREKSIPIKSATRIIAVKILCLSIWYFPIEGRIFMGRQLLRIYVKKV